MTRTDGSSRNRPTADSVSSRLSRRQLVGSLSLAAAGILSGCLTRDDREVHQVFRSWERERQNINRRASIVAYEGEYLRFSVDDRRPVPYETIIGIYDPTGEFKGTVNLTSSGFTREGEMVAYYEVQTDGRHEFTVSPQTGDVDPSRVWIRITPQDEPPDRPQDDPDDH